MKNLNILGIYRSHTNSNKKQFTESLTKLLEDNDITKNTIVTGDININILECINDSDTNDYLNSLLGLGLIPGHRLPTRGPNCLDHVMLNLDPKLFSCKIAILETTITDHSTVFMYIQHQYTQKRAEKTRTITDYAAALATLKDKDIHFLINLDDPDTITTKLTDSYHTSH